MGSDNSIKLEELRLAINAIFDHIQEDLKIEDCPLTENYYWDISDDSLYAVDKDAEAPSVGSLQDDWEFLKPLLSQDRNQAVSLMLIHAAPLLRYLGRKIGQ